MKKLLCVAVIFFGIGGHFLFNASPEDIPVDVPYTVLLQWGNKLNQEADEWNKRCSNNPLIQECVASHQVLDASLAQFIREAEKYHSNEEDCRGELRNRCIEHVVRTFKWNLLNVGKATTMESIDWLIELKVEEDALKKAIIDCMNPPAKL